MISKLTYIVFSWRHRITAHLADLEALGKQSLDLFHRGRYTIDYRQSKIDT